MTAPGVPMIFQGQEMLEDRWFHEQDPLDWSRFEEHKGILQMYTDLFKLRRNWQNNTAGLTGPNVEVHHVNNTENVIAFHRWKDGGPGDSVVVAASFANTQRGDYKIGFPAPRPVAGALQQRLAGLRSGVRAAGRVRRGGPGGRVRRDAFPRRRSAWGRTAWSSCRRTGPMSC